MQNLCALCAFALKIPSKSEESQTLTGIVNSNIMTNQLQQRVYVGTYTDSGSAGIHIYDIDPNSGAWQALGVAETVNPTFLARHPKQHCLYAINEVGNNAARVVAFAVDPGSGLLSELNSRPVAGSAPCHITVDPTGQCLYIANYGDGKLLVYPILAEGQLGECSQLIQHVGSSVDASRQEGPHAHSVNIDPTGHYLMACDLGLDKVMIYRVQPERGQLHPNPIPFAVLDPGSGPRHMAFHPNGKLAYVINEMGNTITGFEYHPKWGGLTTRQVISTLPVGYHETSYCADIHVHPNGRFVYGSNRGHDSLVIFAIDTEGQLTLIGHESVRGSWPRNFAIDPTGQWLYVANQNSDNIVVFKIDVDTGKLTATGVEVSVPKPVCVCVVLS